MAKVEKPARNRDVIAPMGERELTKAQRESRGLSNTREVILVRHAQRGVKKGENYLTPLGKKQAKQRGIELLKGVGLRPEDFDYIDIQASFAGDIDPDTGLPRSAETIQIIADEMGIPDAKRRPRKAYSVDLNNTKHKQHYDHNGLLVKYLPPNYEQMSEEEKLKAEQESLVRVIDEATADQRPEAVAYREEVAGATAFALMAELGLMRYELGKTKSAIMIGMHGTYMEWLFKEALIWEDAKDTKGEKKKGFTSLSEIGGPVDYAEAVRFRLKTNAKGDDALDAGGPPVEVIFGSSRPMIKNATLDMVRVKELAMKYAKLHDILVGF